MGIRLFSFIQIYLREGFRLYIQETDILTEYCGRIAPSFLSFFSPPGHRAGLHFPDSLAVTVDIVIGLGQCDVVDVVLLPE